MNSYVFKQVYLKYTFQRNTMKSSSTFTFYNITQNNIYQTFQDLVYI